MGAIKERLIAKAVEDFSRIYPVADTGDFENCFTYHKNNIVFWFNTTDNSTHVVRSSDLVEEAGLYT